MSDNEFNENQRRRSSRRRRRPEGLTDWEWKADKESNKSRWLVSAKLNEKNWFAFQDWLREEHLNYNSGLNRLIATHPDLKTNA